MVSVRWRTHGHYEMKNSWSVLLYDEEFMIIVFGLKICLFNEHTSNIQFKLDSHFNNMMTFLKKIDPINIDMMLLKWLADMNQNDYNIFFLKLS